MNIQATDRIRCRIHYLMCTAGETHFSEDGFAGWVNEQFGLVQLSPNRQGCREIKRYKYLINTAVILISRRKRYLLKNSTQNKIRQVYYTTFQGASNMLAIIIVITSTWSFRLWLVCRANNTTTAHSSQASKNSILLLNWVYITTRMLPSLDKAQVN